MRLCKDEVAPYAAFSLHAGISVEAEQRERLERLTGYVSRPPVSVERLDLTAPGQLRYRLKTPYRGGTTHIVLGSLDFIAHLAALVPPPRRNFARSSRCQVIVESSVAAPKFQAAPARPWLVPPHFCRSWPFPATVPCKRIPAAQYQGDGTGSRRTETDRTWLKDTAQFSLQYILASPAVTCVLTETTSAEHMAENALVAYPPEPDKWARRRMLAFIDGAQPPLRASMPSSRRRP